MIDTCTRTFAATLLLFLFFLDISHSFRLPPFKWIARTLKSSSLSEHQGITLAPYTGVGCVLIAKPEEKDRFYSNAAILVVSLAENKTHGVILDKPGAFFYGDTTPSAGPFKGNWVFVGGNAGVELGHMFHPYDFGKNCLKVAEGVFTGGVGPALELVDNHKAHPRDFKFIYKTLEWKNGVLEQEIADGRWDVCKMPASLILSQKRETGHIWSAARKALFDETVGEIEEFDNMPATKDLVINFPLQRRRSNQSEEVAPE